MSTPTPQRIRDAIAAIDAAFKHDPRDGPWDAFSNKSVRESLANAKHALEKLYAPDATDPAAIAEQLLLDTMNDPKADTMMRVRAATMLLQHRAAVRENRPRR